VWGLALGVAGALVLRFGIPLSTNAAARAERLPVMTITDLRSRPERTDVLIEGVLSSDNTVFDRGLVAFHHERYRKMYDLWEEQEVRRPELLVNLTDGPVRLAAGTYALDNPTQQPEDPLDRYSGFAAGDTVLAIGRMLEKGDTMTLRADVLYGGNREEYISDQRQHHIINRWLAPVLISCGIILIVAAVVLRWWPRKKETPVGEGMPG
jgi:hypothetical protein